MDTPIFDFVKKYNENKMARFHMPGHKGVSFLGFENIDMTEIKGADDLSCPDGIIKKSEENASELFGTKCTAFSTGGSTQSINAMLYLAFLNRDINEKPFVVAGRNAHKAFMFAAAKIGFQVEWIFPEISNSLCSAVVTKDDLENKLKSLNSKPFAVYITSPDYLGAVTDVKSLSEVCEKYNIPLLVDNAHGAYSAFCEKNFHPILNGADMCCDSAHKTLPALTGCGYLHIAKEDKFNFSENIHNALSIFGSSSPSYLMLQSLDLCNKYISEKLKNDLILCSKKVEEINGVLSTGKINNISEEPLKITLDFSKFQKNGFDIAEHFRKYSIEFEYCDNDFIVFMASPQNSNEDFERLKQAIINLPDFNEKNKKEDFVFVVGNQKMSIRDALFSKSEEISVTEAQGRICAAPTVSCPPAIPIVVSGEEINPEHIKLLKYYGKETIRVIK